MVLRPPPDRADTGFNVSCVDDSGSSRWMSWVVGVVSFGVDSGFGRWIGWVVAVVSFDIVTILLLGVLSWGAGLGASGRLTGRGGCCRICACACWLNGCLGDGCDGRGWVVAGSGWLATVAYDGGDGFESWTLNGVRELSLWAYLLAVRWDSRSVFKVYSRLARVRASLSSFSRVSRSRKYVSMSIFRVGSPG